MDYRNEKKEPKERKGRPKARGVPVSSTISGSPLD